jgi:hypothetical protein
MSKRPVTTDKGIALEIGGNIRDTALEQMADGLRGLGIPETKIKAAIAESKRLNSDKPMTALAMPKIRNMEREMDPATPDAPEEEAEASFPEDVAPEPKAPIQTKSRAMARNVALLLKSRHSVIWIVSSEEARVEEYLTAAAAKAQYKTRTWDVGQGVILNPATPNPAPELDTNDPVSALNMIKAWSERKAKDDALPRERAIWIMRDLPVWIDPEKGGARTLRVLRNLARSLPNRPRSAAQAIIILSPSGSVPPELAAHTMVLEWPMPDRTEVGALLDRTINSQTEENQKIIRARMTEGDREAAIDAAVGLNGEEAQACYAKSLVQFRRIDPVMVAKEKKRIITRASGIEWYDPIPGGFEAVGGLDALKGWLKLRTLAYTPEARKYGLRAPKGGLIVGIPGTGKSLTAKATATAFGVPLLKIDLGAMKSKFVGESEGNLRKTFEVIGSVGRCVVWLDEIEKSLQGATSGSADGGVSADALGTILTWMQERAGEAFVIATANDVSALPPELLRAGRFDVIWFVDLPNLIERTEILKVALREAGREKLKIDFPKLTAATEGFTGSEIAALVPEAMFAAFADDEREITTADLLAIAKSCVPLSKTAGDKIKKLRDWQKERGARPATSVIGEVREAGRYKLNPELDIEDEGDDDEAS